MAPPKRLVDKPCAVCAAVFSPKTSAQSCCSHKCGHIFKRKHLPEPCGQCGTLFTKSVASQKHCSPECSAGARKVNRTVICSECGGSFVRPHGKSRTFCSISCSVKSRSKSGVFPGAALPVGAVRNAGGGYLTEKTEDGKWVLQHRLVIQKKIGRKLARTEHVHHKDGDRTNNSLDNLELWVTKGRNKKDPFGQRLEDVLADFLKQPEIRGIEKQAEAAFRRVFHIWRSS